MEEIDIKEFFKYLLKHLLLVILIPILLVGCVVLYDSSLKTPMYSTYSTLVLVASSSTDTTNSTLNNNDVTLNQKLVATYREFIKSKLVLEQVIDKLNLNMNVEQLSKHVKVEAITDTVIIKITVENADPNTTQAITNAIASVFSKEVVDKFEIDNVAIIDTAAYPEKVSNDTLVRDIILAVAVGLIGTTGILFVIYYFDDTVKYHENLEFEADIPVIGKIFKTDKKTDLLVDKFPNDLTAEAIRTLRTNLRFSGVDRKVRTIAITSTRAGEGKSFISTNLAQSFASTGKKVLLIDCDLRKGRLHRVFNLDNENGLSNYLIDEDNHITKYLNKTSINNLTVITRGICPPNPSELLNSKRNQNLIDKLKEVFDIIIFDCPPCNGLSDALIVGTIADDVLIVSSEHVTTKTALMNVKKSLENVNAHITGNVLNNIDLSKEVYGKYYYYSSDGTKKKKHK
ncbi:MAG: polysaccharide biosynthesis tyrosine autokinase [Bacilli bacterium]|nr:polysaccharide biosynthesis tyrosine autokinase [Bacilli bacterium]